MIWILDDDFRKIDILRKYTFAQYEDKFRDIGTFKINAEITEENMFLLDKTKQHFILFDDRILCVIDSVEKDSDGEFEKSIVVTGRTASYILEERVINGTINFTGNTAEYVHTLINSEFINTQNKRKIYFNLSYDDKNYIDYVCSKVNKQVTGGIVLGEIIDYMEQDNIGFDIVPNLVPTTTVRDTVTNIVDFDFVIMAGKDRRKQNVKGNIPIVFSQSLSNIERTSYNFDKKQHKDVAYVAGEGENKERKWFEIDRGTTQTGWNRRELYIDARDIQSENEDGTVMPDADYEKLIRQRTEEKFSDNNLSEVYSSTIAQTSKYIYGVDYYKGDLVTIVDDELNITIDAQVIGVTKSIQGFREIVDIELSYGVSRKVSNELKPIVSRIDKTESNVKYLENRIDSLFPIGSIVIRADDVNPSRFYGGTWEKIAKGRTLVGVDENDYDFDVLGMAGGNKELTFRALSGAIGNDAGSIGYRTSLADAISSSEKYTYAITGTQKATSTDINHHTQVRTVEQKNEVTNIMNPYLLVNFWQRTA